ncbi:MAG: hypothetical protein ACXWLK_13440 [Rhizomicrobium sp.]
MVRKLGRWRATNPLHPIGVKARLNVMSTEKPFAALSLERVIELRWTLRDIQADRLSLMPANDDDLSILTELGLVEMQNGVPVVTPAGLALAE